MAKRKKSDDAGALLVAVVVGLFLLLKALVPYLLTALALLGLPGLLILQYKATRSRRTHVLGQADRFPSSSGFTWDEEKARIHALTHDLEEDRQQVVRIYSKAEDLGLRLTDASNGSRFDNRMKHGAALNERLDFHSERINRLEVMRSLERDQVLKRIPAWRSIHDAIVSAESRARAATYSVRVYFLIFLTLMVTGLDWVRAISIVEFHPELSH